MDIKHKDPAVLVGHRSSAGLKKAQREIESIEGATILSAIRFGKRLGLQLSNGKLLRFSLGMTGQLLWNPTDESRWRLRIILDNGRLVLCDMRTLGGAGVETPDEWQGKKGSAPDALNGMNLAERFKRRAAAVHAALLDQKCVAGVGNIYATEALFRARINPFTSVKRLGARAATLEAALREVLNEGIIEGGCTLKDYRNLYGEKGRFQKRLRVYGKDGQACPNCGTAFSFTTKLRKRGITYCKRCQT